MSEILRQRLSELGEEAGLSLLTQIQRGLEKESLRVTAGGELAQTPHPRGLGSALTNEYITTDFSEALLEFITPVSTSIADCLDTLANIHRFSYAQLGDELLWSASMPCSLGGDATIPVAEYGSSNIGHMKKIYRRGLSLRYGPRMQTIAGIHYNFSMPESYWPRAQAADGDTQTLTEYITGRYFGMIRNFQRSSWLLIYLFGASPAVCESFVRDRPQHGLQAFEDAGGTLYLPHATALRMGGLGYQSSAQQNLDIRYNQLDRYIEALHGAITQPHPKYAAAGAGVQHSKQLNTSLLQIENEFYSPIRPKRVTRPGEIPLGALRRAGIEYIEVRCVDVNPFLPLGIDAQQIRFLDCFLLYCLLQQSPACDEREQSLMRENMQRVVNRGREPGLQLLTNGGERDMAELAGQLLREAQAVARLLDRAHGSSAYRQSLAAQRAKISEVSLTSSARILAEMRERQWSYSRLAMHYSRKWAERFSGRPLDGTLSGRFSTAAQQSLLRQAQAEAAERVDFETFLKNYYRQYEKLGLDT